MNKDDWTGSVLASDLALFGWQGRSSWIADKVWAFGLLTHQSEAKSVWRNQTHLKSAN